jgi:hypothetical protein
MRTIRALMNSHELDGGSKELKHARAKSVKTSKNQTNPQKNERRALWTVAVTRFPVPCYWRAAHTTE